MVDIAPPPPSSRVSLALAALAIGVLATAAISATYWVARGQRPDLHRDYAILLTQVATIATPFLLLALLNVRRKLPWLLGVALTIGLWGGLLVYGLGHQAGLDGEGVDIRFALTLAASPILITLCCFIAALRTGLSNR